MANQKKKKDAFRMVYLIVGLEMLVAVFVLGFFVVRYGSILLAGLNANKSNTVVENPGYPIDEKNPISPEDLLAVTESTSEKPFEPSSLTLTAVGDNLMFYSSTMSGLQADGSYDYTANFSHVKQYFDASDLTVMSQDTVLAGRELGLTSMETGIYNGGLEFAKGISDAGIDVVLAANNHIMDEGRAGLNTMMSHFSTNYPEISLLGVNASAQAQNEPVYVEKNGIRIAMINYTNLSNQTADLDSSPYLVNMYNEEWLTSILTAAEANADFIIAFPFWGEQNNLDYTLEQEEQAKFLIEHGVDLIIGTYPHVVEPVKWVTADNGNKGLVYYSLGNFQALQNSLENTLGAMATITLAKEETGTTIADYQMDFLVTHYEQSESDYYNIVTTYPLEEYTDELAARHGITASGAEGYTLGALRGLSSRILSDCELKQE